MRRAPAKVSDLWKFGCVGRERVTVISWAQCVSSVPVIEPAKFLVPQYATWQLAASVKKRAEIAEFLFCGVVRETDRIVSFVYKHAARFDILTADRRCKFVWNDLRSRLRLGRDIKQTDV